MCTTIIHQGHLMSQPFSFAMIIQKPCKESQEKRPPNNNRSNKRGGCKIPRAIELRGSTWMPE